MARTNQSSTSTAGDTPDADLVVTNDPAVPTAHVPVTEKEPEGSGTKYTMKDGTKVAAEPHVIDRLKSRGA